MHIVGKKRHTKQASHLAHEFPEDGEVKPSTKMYKLDLVNQEVPIEPLVSISGDFQQIQPVLDSPCELDVSVPSKSKSLLHVKAWIEGNKK